MVYQSDADIYTILISKKTRALLDLCRTSEEETDEEIIMRAIENEN